MNRLISFAMALALAASSHAEPGRDAHVGAYADTVYRIEGSRGAAMYRRVWSVDVAPRTGEIAILHCEEVCSVTLLRRDGTVSDSVKTPDATDLRWTSPRDLAVQIRSDVSYRFFRSSSGHLTSAGRADGWLCAVNGGAGPVCADSGDRLLLRGKVAYELDPYREGAKSIAAHARLGETIDLPLADGAASFRVEVAASGRYRIVVREGDGGSEWMQVLDEHGRRDTSVAGHAVRIRVSPAAGSRGWVDVRARVGATVPSPSAFRGLSITPASLITAIVEYGDRCRAIALAPRNGRFDELANIPFVGGGCGEIVDSSFDETLRQFVVTTRLERLTVSNRHGEVQVRRTARKLPLQAFTAGELTGSALILDGQDPAGR